jgi:PEP-CTERM motif
MGKRNKLALLFGVAVGALSGGAALAGPIPYPDVGTPNPVTYTFTAASTGVITAYFAGSGASYGEVVGMSINGAAPTVWGLDDHSSSVGDTLVMGDVVAGDTLVFEDAVYTSGTTGPNPPVGADFVWSSIPSMNIDGGNHVYSTTATAGQAYAGSPAGVYVAFEDEKFHGSDYNYHDDTFVFTNTSVTPTIPEASTWAMMLAGFGGLGFAAFRRSQKASVSVA